MALPGGADNGRPRGRIARAGEWLRFSGLLAAFWLTGLAHWIGRRAARMIRAA